MNFVPPVPSVILTVSSCVPKKYYFHDNKSFIMAYAEAWRDYTTKNKGSILLIYPETLYQMLKHYDIRTCKGNTYVPDSRGPFNLIRSAYLKAQKTKEYLLEVLQNKEQNAETKQFNRAMAEHWGTVADLIAYRFVNANGCYAYE